MSDYNSSLPVRTENNGDVAVKIVDGTITSQALSVDSSGKIIAKMNDGSGNSLASSTSAPIGTEQALIVRNIPSGTQAISAASLPLPTGASTSALQSSVQGSASGGTAATSSQLGGLIFNSSAPILTNGQQAALQGDSSGNLKVNLMTPIPTGTNSIGNIGTVGAVTAITNALPAGTNALGSVLANLQVAGSAVTSSNPVPVTISSASPGTTVQNYNTVASLAVGATSNHDYTVTAAKVFSFDRVWASASGKLKIEVQIETGVSTGVFNTRFVGFNSTATPNIDLDMVTNQSVAAGVRVRIIRTNKDNQVQDVYSTIEGSES